MQIFLIPSGNHGMQEKKKKLATGFSMKVANVAIVIDMS